MFNRKTRKFEGMLMCTDLDGTLLKNDKSISRENLDAVDYFKQNGGLFTFVTGRMPFFVSDIYNIVKPNAPIVCVNGGGIYDYDRNDYLWKEVMPASVTELVEYADKNIDGMGIQVNTFDKIYYCKNNDAMETFRLVTNTPNLVCSYNDVSEPIAKIVFGDTDIKKMDKLRTLLANHPRSDEFDFITSEETLHEILPKGISKGKGLTKLAKLLGIDMSKTIAVGDYYNDISMIESVKLGIAVSNAQPEVKTSADVITVSNEESAIANIIDNLDKNIYTL
ncbi:MAG: HAD family phosphatase [Clostridia bacterium]|nr:HAD family phosphatase [Clostridia bacterium]